MGRNTIFAERGVGRGKRSVERRLTLFDSMRDSLLFTLRSQPPTSQTRPRITPEVNIIRFRSHRFAPVTPNPRTVFTSVRGWLEEGGRSICGTALAGRGIVQYGYELPVNGYKTICDPRGFIRSPMTKRTTSPTRRRPCRSSCAAGRRVWRSPSAPAPDGRCRCSTCRGWRAASGR